MKVPIACTLTSDEQVSRVEEWRALVAEQIGESRRLDDGSLLFRFPPGAELATRVGALAAAEQSCCSFFTFTIRIDGTGTELVVSAPPDAAPIIDDLFAASS